MASGWARRTVEWVCGVPEGVLVEKDRRERDEKAAARFFLIANQDWHGSLPPSSNHYKTKEKGLL
jgi:hypothetical protein